MRHAFECQNELGRLCDETIYQNALAARLREAGVSAETEVKITVEYETFAKNYWLDLVVANAGVYELKTAATLVGEHEAQLLNYLLLCGSCHGKLINFRPWQVESKFINTTLSREERCAFKIENDRWQARNDTDHFFYKMASALLRDWGTCLDMALYYEALCHFFGGEDCVVRQVPLRRSGAPLGSQRFYLITPETAFRLTAVADETPGYEQSLRSLLGVSPLSAIQWVNIARHQVRFVSIVK